jgi:hypothetical protein
MPLQPSLGPAFQTPRVAGRALDVSGVLRPRYYGAMYLPYYLHHDHSVHLRCWWPWTWPEKQRRPDAPSHPGTDQLIVWSIYLPRYLYLSPITHHPSPTPHARLARKGQADCRRITRRRPATCPDPVCSVAPPSVHMLTAGSWGRRVRASCLTKINPSSSPVRRPSSHTAVVRYHVRTALAAASHAIATRPRHSPDPALLFGWPNLDIY